MGQGRLLDLVSARQKLRARGRSSGAKDRVPAQAQFRGNNDVGLTRSDHSWPDVDQPAGGNGAAQASGRVGGLPGATPLSGLSRVKGELRKVDGPRGGPDVAGQ